ncbi:hypothetical protein Tco_1418672 [Tanacetum coccineum]
MPSNVTGRKRDFSGKKRFPKHFIDKDRRTPIKETFPLFPRTFPNVSHFRDVSGTSYGIPAAFSWILDKYCHTHKFCWSKPEEAKYAENEDQEDFLFMAKTDTRWFKATFGILRVIAYITLPSNTSDDKQLQIKGGKSKFKDLVESVRFHVRLLDFKQLQSKGS